MLRMVRHWYRWSKKAVESLSLKIFKIILEQAPEQPIAGWPLFEGGEFD